MSLRSAQISDKFLDDPLYTEEIVLLRRPDGLYTNVPHLVIHHSPAGFEWGCGGSGPSDLALNLCEATLLYQIGYEGRRMKCWHGWCFEIAYTMHQDFKWQFIAPAAREGCRLPFTMLLAWVEDWLV